MCVCTRVFSLGFHSYTFLSTLNFPSNKIIQKSFTLNQIYLYECVYTFLLGTTIKKTQQQNEKSHAVHCASFILHLLHLFDNNYFRSFHLYHLLIIVFLYSVFFYFIFENQINRFLFPSFIQLSMHCEITANKSFISKIHTHTRTDARTILFLVFLAYQIHIEFFVCVFHHYNPMIVILFSAVFVVVFTQMNNNEIKKFQVLYLYLCCFYFLHCYSFGKH